MNGQGAAVSPPMSKAAKALIFPVMPGSVRHHASSGVAGLRLEAGVTATDEATQSSACYTRPSTIARMSTRAFSRAANRAVPLTLR